MDVVVDSSVWIAYLDGEVIQELEYATVTAELVLSPLVIAEVLSGILTPHTRATFGELIQDYPMHNTPLSHWMDVGDLRRTLAAKGINVTIPDAHVAQCALDRNATLLARDDIFKQIATQTPLRLTYLR